MKRATPLSRRIGLLLMLLVLLAGMAYVALRSGPLAPTRVTVVQAASGSFAPSLFGIGTVEARRSVLIGPTAAGRVVRVLVDVGDRVKAGQLLAEMDPVDLDQRLAAQQAALARAGSTASAVQAQLRDTTARREMTRLATQRTIELGRQNFISTGAVEAKLQEQTSADAALSAAESNLAAARQDLQRLGAERDALQQQRDRLRLLAPADGLVISRDAEAGTTLVAGQPVLRLIDPSSLWIRTRLDQGRSAGLAVGLPAQIVMRANPGQALPGRLVRIEAVSDSITEERVAQVAFDALPPGVSVGELAEVTLQLAQTSPAIVLPNASLQRQGDRLGVWRLVDGSPSFVPVRIGQASLDGQVQVLEGLRSGDAVVVHSERALNAAMRVKVVPALAANTP